MVVAESGLNLASFGRSGSPAGNCYLLMSCVDTERYATPCRSSKYCTLADQTELTAVINTYTSTQDRGNVGPKCIVKLLTEYKLCRTFAFAKREIFAAVVVVAVRLGVWQQYTIEG